MIVFIDFSNCLPLIDAAIIGKVNWIMCNLRVDALQVLRSYMPVIFPGKNEPRVAMQIKDSTVFSKMIIQRCTVYD